jgi:Flp pilus assembly protein TadB
MKTLYRLLVLSLLMIVGSFPAQAAVDFYPEEATHHPGSRLVDELKKSKAEHGAWMKRGISRVVEKVKEHIEKWKTPDRKKMSRGRKALIFAGVGLLLFICLPWLIVGDLLASNLALVLCWLGPILVLIGGDYGVYLH